MTELPPDLIQKMVSAVPQLRALGIELVSFDAGEATLALPYSEHLIGFPETGVIAGGAIYSLMDSVAGMAVYAKLQTYKPIATLDLRIDYMKPATPGETVYGWAECYKLTRSVAFVRGVAYHDDKSNPIANVSGTFILPPEKEKQS
ncbi:MAG: PaaI family thioesterase [Sphingomonadales bacterium]|jgi:uncharacterized protein (TIGR00369 family)